MASVTNAVGMFDSCPNITSNLTYGMRYAYNVASEKLDATALNLLFTNLGTAVATGVTTITVTGNPGTATMDISIANNKGWVVVP